MNYIAEIRAFYEWNMFNSIPADAQALWHALVYLNNKCAIQVRGQWLWRVEFTVANTTLESILKFSRTQLDRMRNILIQSGRIGYRKGRGNQSGTYRLIPFDTQYVTQNVTQSDTQTDTQTVTQVWRKLEPLNNSNIYSNSTLNYNFSGGDDARAGASAQEAIEVFLENRNLKPEQYFGFTENTRAQAEQLTREIYTRFALKPPTKQDIVCVFNCVRHSVPPDIPPDDPRDHSGWRIEFPKDKVDLLIYAFEAAAAVGNPGSWNYIRGVMAKLAQRGIKTLEEAETYDFDRAEMS